MTSFNPQRARNMLDVADATIVRVIRYCKDDPHAEAFPATPMTDTLASIADNSAWIRAYINAIRLSVDEIERMHAWES